MAPKAGEAEEIDNFKDVELAPSSPWRKTRVGHGSTPESPSKPSAPSRWNLSHAMDLLLRSKAVASCLLYSFCSVSMILTNKSLTSSYQSLTPIDLNILLVVFQAIIAVVSVEACKRLNWIEPPDVTPETVKLWIPVNVFFCSMLFTGMASLQHNSVPMVTIFKNITNLMVAGGDYALFGATVETLAFASFVVILGGAIAAAWNDIHAGTMNPVGLFWMVGNCLSTAGYVLYMKYATKHIKLSKVGMVYVNNLLAVFFLLPTSFLRGEVRVFFETSAIHTADYLFKNLLAGLTGFSLNFAALNCVATTGPTTYAVVGALNKVPVAFLGWALFDNAITSKTWFFICVSLCGGFLYSFAKIRSNAMKSGEGK